MVYKSIKSYDKPQGRPKLTWLQIITEFTDQLLKQLDMKNIDEGIEIARNRKTLNKYY